MNVKNSVTYQPRICMEAEHSFIFWTDKTYIILTARQSEELTFHLCI